MTKDELSQVYYLDREIKMHKRRLYELREQLRGMRVVDGVQGSDDSEPFQVRNHIVRGVGPSATSRSCVELIEQRKELISECQAKCEAEKLRIEQYIAEIPNSMIRQIFTQRFIELKKWNEIADAVGGSNSEDSVRMTVDRYLH